MALLRLLPRRDVGLNGDVVTTALTGRPLPRAQRANRREQAEGRGTGGAELSEAYRGGTACGLPGGASSLV